MPRDTTRDGQTQRTDDGLLRIVRWAHDLGLIEGEQRLGVDAGPRPVAMAHSPATGQGLVSNGHLGVDLIRLAAGKGFAPHTHPGDHLLIVVAGRGTISYEGRVYPTEAGQVYLLEGAAPHAVGAITDHAILSIGCPHKPVDAPDRMTPAPYRAIAAEFGDLHCLICDQQAQYPQRLHERGCSHCPCEACNGGEQ